MRQKLDAVRVIRSNADGAKGNVRMAHVICFQSRLRVYSIYDVLDELLALYCTF